MSKGSSPRPFSVSTQEYAQRWDAIFGKDWQPLKVEPNKCERCGKLLGQDPDYIHTCTPKE